MWIQPDALRCEYGGDGCCGTPDDDFEVIAAAMVDSHRTLHPSDARYVEGETGTSSSPPCGPEPVTTAPQRRSQL